MDSNLVWVDLEMTGLDINKEHIIEMACIITDKNLNLIEEGPDIVINQPDSILNNMDQWCREHHGKSGMIFTVAFLTRFYIACRYCLVVIPFHIPILVQSPLLVYNLGH